MKESGTQCVILAGGLGTRVRHIAENLPKHLIPVLGTPFAHHQLSWLSDHGVDEVVYCIGFRGRQIMDFVGDGSSWNLRVRWVDEGETLRGTGGALRLALDRQVLAEQFLVLYGDSYLPVDPRSILMAFRAGDDAAMMTVFENRDMWDRSNVLYSDGRVLAYDKQPSPELRARMRFIDYGLTALRRSTIEERIPSGTVADVADLYSSLASEDRLAGYEVTDRFFEIGSEEGIRDLERWLRDHPSSPHSTQ